MVRRKHSFNNEGFVPEIPNGTTQISHDMGMKETSGTEVVVSKELSKEDKLLKRSILKNVIIISFAFTCLFTSFNGMANLQSSINKTLGTTSLWVLYAALVFSCAFLPTFLIKKIKVKWTLVTCMLTYSTYMVAQFLPRYYTLIPTAIILGLGAAPMWSAKCTYLTVVGETYGKIVGESGEVIITRFFGIFFLFFQSSQVIGNLISSLVLSGDAENVTRSDEFLDLCGVNYCPGVTDELMNPPETNSTTPAVKKSSTNLYIMAGVYLACALASAAIVGALVDSLTRYGEDERNAQKKQRSGLQLLMATFKHVKNPYQVLIIPLTFWSGIEQAFIGADFTAAFVTCGIGVHMVGYVMICYGVFDALFSFGFSPVIKLVGRVPIFILGAAINVGVIILMFMWKPNPDETIIFFIMAALWGTADAIWQTQINAFYGVIFPGASEAAFSNYRLWESLGFIVAYFLSSKICISSKLILNLAVLGTGMVGYLAIEIWEKIRKRNMEK